MSNVGEAHLSRWLSESAKLTSIRSGTRPGFHHRQLPETTSACSASCGLYASGVKIYAWATTSNDRLTGSEVLRLTSTIITIINTVANTTSTSTEFPPEYNSSVPTNNDGTRVQTISFTRQGQAQVTIMYVARFESSEDRAPCALSGN